jgi:hypothetical protein
MLSHSLTDATQIAKILTEVTGKPISHARISPAEFKAGLETLGLAGDRVQIMLDIQDEVARGMENKPDNGEVLRLTGRKPVSFREWAEKHKAVWE